MLLRHLFWSALVGPPVAVATLLVLATGTLPFVQPPGVVKAIPGIADAPVMLAYGIFAAYLFGLVPCLFFGLGNSLMSRFVPRRSALLSGAATMGGATALIAVVVWSRSLALNFDTLLQFLVAGAMASVVCAAIASRPRE